MMALFIQRKRRLFYRLVLILFGIYLMLVIAFVFFPIPFPENWPHNLSKNEWKNALQSINLVPLRHTGILSPSPFSNNTTKDIIANLLLTVPLGMAVPYLASLRAKHVLLLAIVAGLFFESVELAVKLITGTFYHTVDINDVIMNTLGVLAGYMLFVLIRMITVKLQA
jgi:glycopeptide antibiotics resistance protein